MTVSNRRDRPAAKSAYPTHLLGGIAILNLDSKKNPQVHDPFEQGYESGLSPKLPATTAPVGSAQITSWFGKIPLILLVSNGT